MQENDRPKLTHTQPRISVIIPTYNSGRYLVDAVRSVIDQTYRPHEIIIVDDGSTDDTRAIVATFDSSIKYIYQRNQGVAAARNTGIAAAVGELICFLDADDSWAPQKLQTQIDFIRAHPEVGFVFADEEEYDERGLQCASLLATSRYFSDFAGGGVVPDAYRKLLVDNFVPTSTVMARRRCVDVAGPFDTELKAAEDRDMWCRLAAYFPIAYVPGVLARKRALPTSLSRNLEATLDGRIRLWTKARRLFPGLVSQRTLNTLLAPTYVQLGYDLLRKDRTREARQAGLSGLLVARDPRAWLLAGSLVVFSFTGRAFADLAFRASRRMRPWSSASAGSPTSVGRPEQAGRR